MTDVVDHAPDIDGQPPAAPPIVVSGFRKSLVAEPDKYDRNTKTYTQWKRQVWTYIHANQRAIVNDDERIIVALSYMRGENKAGRWATFVTDKILDHPNETPTYTQFWDLADQIFLPPNKANDAAVQLENLVQGQLSAEEYFIEFEMLADRAGYADTAFDTLKIRLACRKLAKALVDNIHNTDNIPTTWQDFMKRVTALDNNWRISDSRTTNAAQTLRGTPQGQQNPRWATMQPSNQAQNRPAHPIYQQNRLASPYRDLNAMDVDAQHVAAQMPYTRFEGDRQAQLRAGACFYCKEIGHMAKNCPRLPPNRQNMFMPVPRPAVAVRTTNTETALGYSGSQVSSSSPYVRSQNQSPSLAPLYYSPTPSVAPSTSISTIEEHSSAPQSSFNSGFA